MSENEFMNPSMPSKAEAGAVAGKRGKVRTLPPELQQGEEFEKELDTIIKRIDQTVERPEASARPPLPPLEDWWEREDERIRAEIDEMRKRKNLTRQDRSYMIRLRAQALKLFGIKHVSRPKTAPGSPKPAPNLGAMIDQANRVN